MTALLSWLLLAAQIAAIGWIIVRELLRPVGRNLYAVGIGIAMLALVQGQAWWMLDQVLHHGLRQHINQLVAVDAVELANLYCFVWTGAFVLAYVVTAGRQRPEDAGVAAIPPEESSIESFRRYGIPGIWVFVASTLLVLHSGGIANVLLHPGRLIAGQTVILILLSLGKVPFISDIVERHRPHPFAIALFVPTLTLLLLNSRFLALFAIFQVGLVLNYSVAELRRRYLVLGAAISALILFAYGLFRDFESNRVSGQPFGISDFLRFYSQRAASGPFDWFYRFNVEGFAGLAGILTKELHGGGIRHDFGASTASILTQLIPNAIRTNPALPFHSVSQFFDSLYPYPGGSIVRPGLELAYAHFGVPGIVALGLVLGWLAVRLHASMLSPRSDRVLIGILSVQALLLIRGTFVDALFFGLGDFVMLFVFRQMVGFKPRQLISLLTRLGVLQTRMAGRT